MAVTSFQTCAVAVGILLASGSAVAGESLLLGEVHPQRAAAATVRHLVNDPAAASVRIVRANPSVVSAASRELDIDLGLRHVTAVLDSAHTSSLGSVVWSGQVRGSRKIRPNTSREVRRDERNSVMLVRRGSGITGSIRVDGRLYRLQPLPGGNHAIVEIDEARMPPEHPVEVDTSAPTLPLPHPNAALWTNATQGDDVIRVQVISTREAVRTYGGDMLALAELSLAETNQGYANSGIDMKVQLANYSVTEHVETTQRADLASFRYKGDRLMDGVHALRDQYGADLNILLVADSSACGVAPDVASGEHNAFAVVSYRCAAGYYSFGHALGHLQGAMHDRPASANARFAYGHGYVDGAKQFRTIMASPCGAACPRLNYWSTPDKTYDGRVIGDAAVADNRRVLQLTKADIAHYRDGGGVGNQRPSANFSASVQGRLVRFTDMSGDPDGTVVSRRWEFGDASVSTDLHPRHSYARPGIYTVKLIVTDDLGAAHLVTRRVEVSGIDRLEARDVSGMRGSEQYWTLDVPATASGLKFVMSAASGDADLYVRYGQTPTTSAYDCRAFASGGSRERCDISDVRPGTWHVMVRGYSDFSGVSLTASYDEENIQRYRNDVDVNLIDAAPSQGRSVSNPSVESVITVAGRDGHAGRRARVEVEIVHTYIGDLVVDLVSPAGTRYRLHNRAGASNDNLSRIYTVDLSAESLNGAWKLRVFDAASGDTGYINHWSLSF